MEIEFNSPAWKLHLYDISASLAHHYKQALLLLFLVVSRRFTGPTNGLYWLETFSSLTRLEGFPSHPTLNYRRFFLSVQYGPSFNASISLNMHSWMLGIGSTYLYRSIPPELETSPPIHWVDGSELPAFPPREKIGIEIRDRVSVSRMRVGTGERSEVGAYGE